MSTADRDEVLFRKPLCGKCFLVSAKFSLSHECGKIYVCILDFVKRNGKLAKYSKRVLTCLYHFDKDFNNEL